MTFYRPGKNGASEYAHDPILGPSIVCGWQVSGAGDGDGEKGSCSETEWDAMEDLTTDMASMIGTPLV